MNEHYERLRERRDWLTERIKAKQRVPTKDGKGWDTNYDAAERDALTWALEQLDAAKAYPLSWSEQMAVANIRREREFRRQCDKAREA